MSRRRVMHALDLRVTADSISLVYSGRRLHRMIKWHEVICSVHVVRTIRSTGFSLQEPLDHDEEAIHQRSIYPREMGKPLAMSKTLDLRSSSNERSIKNILEVSEGAGII